jgi:hypothetical protein
MAATEAEIERDLRDRISARKRVELHQKLDGLHAEFAHWVAEAGASKRLRKHQSQIERLTYQLGGMADGVAGLLESVPAEADRMLSESRPLQLRVLEVHRLWDYFRSKLNLRYVDWFADYLAAADDFAWECYEPQRAAAASPRADPLVFLTGEFSPYTHTRATRYEVEPLPGVMDSKDFLTVAADLPIPVIGVPWYQVAHLPDAPLIGHEIGHNLERELDLTSAVEEHLVPVLSALGDPERELAWTAWRAELFADLIGLLCTGPAFVGSMADLLAADPVQVADQARIAAAWEPHPPASLRMRALTHALGLQDFEAEAEELRDAWEVSFPPDARDRFADDVPAVVEALWAVEYPQLRGPLHQAIRFSASQQVDAIAAQGYVLDGMAPPSNDVRCLIAAARLAFDADPEGYHAPRQGAQGKTAQQLLLEHIVSLRTNEPRHEEIERSPSPDEDRATGRALFDRIERIVAAKDSTKPKEEPR